MPRSPGCRRDGRAAAAPRTGRGRRPRAACGPAERADGIARSLLAVARRGRRVGGCSRLRRASAAAGEEGLDLLTGVPGRDPLFLLTRARCRQGVGNDAGALADLDAAVTACAAEGDLALQIDALEVRSRVREAVGDLAGALADARLLGDLVWQRHRRQVGGFMDQVWSRAGVEGQRRDLEARARVLVRFAEQDPLTNLANRRAIEQFCASMRASEQVCLVLVDVDHFKDVNDRHGHLVGDAVLREVAAVLSGSVRAVDRVGALGRRGVPRRAARGHRDAGGRGRGPIAPADRGARLVGARAGAAADGQRGRLARAAPGDFPTILARADAASTPPRERAATASSRADRGGSSWGRRSRRPRGEKVSAMTSAPPGWYPDASQPGQERWWDGGQWSHVTRPAADGQLAQTQAQTPDAAQTRVDSAAGDDPYAPPREQDTPPAQYGGQQRTASSRTASSRTASSPTASSSTASSPTAQRSLRAAVRPVPGRVCASGPTAPDGMPLASRWRRFGGLVIDGIIVSFVAALLGWKLVSADGDELRRYWDQATLAAQVGGNPPDSTTFIANITPTCCKLALLQLLVSAVYEIPLTKLRGQTVGKMAMRTRVRPIDHEGLVSWGQAVMRWVGYRGIAAMPRSGACTACSTRLDLLGPAPADLHDKIAKTVVARKP